jgi:hypothetical protein
MFQGIWALIKAIKWVFAEKKALETDAKAYLSPGRAAEARLWLERLFLALEQGDANPNFEKLPKFVRWFCGGTQIDNYIGTFGQRVLKSQKLADASPLLQADIDAWQGPAGDRAKP